MDFTIVYIHSHGRGMIYSFLNSSLQEFCGFTPNRILIDYLLSVRQITPEYYSISHSGVKISKIYGLKRIDVANVQQEILSHNGPCSTLASTD
jgi:hypothetical protein